MDKSKNNSNSADTLKAYERIYAESEQAYSSQPFFLVKKIHKYLQTGLVVDFGAGEGRNSVFLAEQSFLVEAIDFAAGAVKKLEEKIKKKSLNIRTKRADLSRLNLAGKFHVGVCTFVLHNLSATAAKKFILKMQKHTEIGGVNVLACFTKQGYFFRKDPKTGNFFPSQTELKKLYTGWKIHEINTKKIRLRPIDAAGKPLFGDCVVMLAQKL
ncbi:methyltransferase domain-containing protein [Candidatus Gracilibacteria bacterium]|nr:methyltransferase domain-containing protein [Candidatus Gracilibacteria bacterium]MCF7856064.1 methyltransferase domain-containing protein [Candidatus Gracilibacteria bacterium]MCF7896381.1 methyltransferase domain-containing protein [Candidatus Gracilibacteria bacterium]